MRVALVNALLSLSVATAWLGVLGLLRLRTPLDRLHCVTFVNCAAGGALLLAALAQEGFSDRVVKLGLLLILLLLGGALLAHATARALHARRRA